MRLLTRVLIWWRWRMAVVAALLLTAMLLSGWFELHFKLPLTDFTSGYLDSGCAGIFHIEGLPVPPYQLDMRVGGPQWALWEFKCKVDGAILWSAFAPLWVVALPPLALAVAGFRAKRRQPKPGECPRCRHPLLGAMVCPECGRTAEAS